LALKHPADIPSASICQAELQVLIKWHILKLIVLDESFACCSYHPGEVRVGTSLDLELLLLQNGRDLVLYEGKVLISSFCVGCDWTEWILGRETGRLALFSCQAMPLVAAYWRCKRPRKRRFGCPRLNLILKI